MNIATANPIPSLAAASHRAATSPSLELLEARRARDGLASPLRHEQVAMSEFLIALADFDRRRGWEVLGHSSLFAFLHVELKFPNPSAFWRMSAARLLQRFPDLVGPLRDGRLCCSATVELAKVLTEGNRAEVLPRFYGLSALEAQELVAELQPRQAPATRTVVTAPARLATAWPFTFAATPLTLGEAVLGEATLALPEPPAPRLHPDMAPPSQLRTSEVAFGGGARTTPPRDDIEPLTADLRRLHVTVSRQFLKKLDAARHGLSHSILGASAEQVLEAALDLLIEKQARSRGLVKRPRTVAPTPTPTATTTATATATTTATATATATATTTTTTTTTALLNDLFPTEPPPHRRTGPRQHIPASVRRAVWQRDGGGVCGSTHRLELDHVVPWARWGGETVDDLRVVCHAHNALAARQAFGERYVARYGARSRPRGPAGRAG